MQAGYTGCMKVNREILARGALKLLNEVGLEQLTLRRLGVELKVQAAAMYWHFKKKEELIDEMATMVLAEAAPNIVPVRKQSDWKAWVVAFGEGLRNTLLRYRDGARMVAGTRLTNTEYMKTTEVVGTQLVESGFTVRQTVVLLSTIYNYTLSFVMEEQAVFPIPGKRSEQYDIRKRNEQLSGEAPPLLRQAGPILFDRFERRYKEGLNLILQGAARQLRSRNIATKPRSRRSR
jgi:TetR/AcrR family transcriptional regulator, tetracycline repressor protein